MRTPLPLLLLLLSALVFAPSDRAAALPVVELVFVASSGVGTPGSGAIRARAGDLLTAEIRVAAGRTGVSAYGLSLEFDADLGNELDLVSTQELLPAGFSLNFTPGPGFVQDSTLAQRGRILTLEAATLGNGPESLSFAIARIVLRVTARVASDGADLEIGFFAPGIDGLFDNDGHDLAGAVTFAGGAVDAVPEPATAALLALGLAALARYRPGTEKR